MTKAKIIANIEAAKTRSKLLKSQADTLRKKSPVKAAQISSEARAEDALIESLEAKLAALAVNTLIEFKDTGQDFLQWLVSPSGEVIDCAPMQRFHWVGQTVVATEGNKPGETYLVLSGADGDVRLKHAVISMESVNVQSLEELESTA